MENSPSSKVQAYWRIVELVEPLVKWTVRGAVPLVRSAPAEMTGGADALVWRRNHGAAVGEVLKKATSCVATLGTPPAAEGCVKSPWRLAQGQTNLSPRGFRPSAHR